MPSAVPWPDVAKELNDITSSPSTMEFKDQESSPSVAVRQDTQFPICLMRESLRTGGARSEESQLILLVDRRHVWFL